MHDDERMDRLLTKAMAAEVPTLSPGFDTAVLRRVRPRRLSWLGRFVMVAYAVAAAAVAAWVMRGLDPSVVAAGVSTGLVMAAGAGVYVERLVCSVRLGGR